MEQELTANELAEKGIVIRKDVQPSKELNLKTRINSPELIFALKQEIEIIRNRINMNWLLIAKYLYLVKRDRGWQYDGSSSWRNWVVDNQEFLHFGIRSCDYFVQIWERLILQLKLSFEQIGSIEKTNARELARFATAGNVDGLIKMAKRLSHRQFLFSLQQMEKKGDIVNLKIMDCKHKKLIVLYKCPTCGSRFYTIPKEAEIITDKSQVLDIEKVKKIAPKCEVVKVDKDYHFEKKTIQQKKNVSRALKAKEL